MVKRYNFGLVAKNYAVNTLVECMNELIDTPKAQFEPGLEKARTELNWDKEKQVLVDFYSNLKREL